MTLPPVANLFAVAYEDPVRLEALERRLECCGEFDVWQPALGWVAAIAPLPWGPAERPEVRAAGLAFVEGEEVVSAPQRSAAVVAELARRAPERLASLPGDFGFLCFERDGAATAVRSAGGLVPVYLHAAGDGLLAIGTRLDYFVRFLPEPPVLDPLVNALWTTGWPLLPDERTFLRGVSILGRGRYARARPTRSIEVGSYWDPRPADDERLIATPDHARRLRQILIGKLERDLHPSGGNLLTLSGGVDSSSLGALAVGALGRPTATLSFLSTDERARARDEHYIDALQGRFHFDPTWRVTLDVAKRRELLSKPHGACFHVIHPALCMLPELHARWPVRVLFGGEFADEVVGTLAGIPDWAAHTSLRQLVAGGLSSLPSGPRDLLVWPKRRLMHALRRPALRFPGELPELIRPELRDEYREWLERRRREAGRDRRPLRQLAHSTEQDGFVAMNWEAASALGVRRSIPFFNREVLELAFSCHPGELIGPGTKKLLRTALTRDVPEENLQRPDKAEGPHPPDAQWRWAAPLPESLRAVVREDWCPRPPAEVDQWDALRLTQLVEFVRRLEGARSEEPQLSPR